MLLVWHACGRFASGSVPVCRLASVAVADVPHGGGGRLRSTATHSLAACLSGSVLSVELGFVGLHEGGHVEVLDRFHALIIGTACGALGMRCDTSATGTGRPGSVVRMYYLGPQRMGTYSTLT